MTAPEDVRKLVDEARAELSKVRFGARRSGRVMLASHLELLRRVTDALEAAQRPPISPEVREEVFRLLYEASGSQFMRPNERHSMVTEQRDALLARFSFPSQPVYDEEKVVALVRSALYPSATVHWHMADDYARKAVRALVAALPGLTKDPQSADSGRAEP